MLNRLEPQSPDALLALIKLHAADPRGEKIDLGVGVYRTEEGDTPVFAAIKEAERHLVAEQDSKSYLGPEGDMGFVNALMPTIFGEDATMGGRISGMQTPGGTGAVRLAAALAQKAGMTRLHMGTPSWPNHAQILGDLKLEMVPFEHANPDGTANVEAVVEAIAGASPDEGGETERIVANVVFGRHRRISRLGYGCMLPGRGFGAGRASGHRTCPVRYLDPRSMEISSSNPVRKRPDGPIRGLFDVRPATCLKWLEHGQKCLCKAKGPC